MKAVVWHGVGDIRLDDVEEPRIEAPTDAIVRITASAICGTDLHLVRGTVSGMKPGTILGHEGIGIVEEVGSEVRNLSVGDRIVIPSTIACGSCSYCRAATYSQCDVANPHGNRAGTAFFGGPEFTGPFNGLQAEFARVPFANVGPVKLPDEVSDDEAILLSDIFPTGYFGAELAEITPGDTVAVFGCGPVGLFAILSAHLKDAGRVIAVDHEPSRLDKARELGAEVVNFAEEDPVETIVALTSGIGVDRAIDAVGVDAQRPRRGPAAQKLEEQGQLASLEQQREDVAAEAKPEGELWVPGDAPNLAVSWAVDALCKAGTLGVVGVYPETLEAFPIGKAMNKNLTIQMGNCNHRKYIPSLLERVRAGGVDVLQVLSHVRPVAKVIDAYRTFDTRTPGWVKVALQPMGVH